MSKRAQTYCKATVTLNSDKPSDDTECVTRFEQNTL